MSLVLKAINFARQHTTINNLQKKVIIESCKSLLISKNTPWTKKGDDGDFDLSMGSNSGAEVCELVGIYLLSQIKEIIPLSLVGLNRDDGLAVTLLRPRQADILKKKLCKLFRDNGLSIDVNANIKIVNFLDVTFDLDSGLFRPYRKPNDITNYVQS